MGHMSVAGHVTQIIQNEEEGPVDFEFLKSKIEQVVVKHNEVRAFISLCQNIEDRSILSHTSTSNAISFYRYHDPDPHKSYFC